MTKIQIIGSIMAATGKKIPGVAADHGYPRIMFYRVINGESTNPIVRDIIVNLIRKPENEIWPEVGQKGR